MHSLRKHATLLAVAGPERPLKVPRPPSPATLGPGELFFKADSGTRLVLGAILSKLS